MIVDQSGECGRKYGPKTIRGPCPARTLRPMPRYLASSNVRNSAGTAISSATKTAIATPIATLDQRRS